MDGSGKDFADWLRARRVELLLTQEQLAERAGISVRTIRNLEAGRSTPRGTTRELIREVLGAQQQRGQRRSPVGWAAPAQLPPDVGGFTGRGAELAELDALRDGARQEPLTLVVCALSGTAGVGKTALAVHWAHQAAEGFPDGQLFADLQGYGPDDPVPAQVALEGFLLALGVDEARLPRSLDQRSARYRSLTAGRQILVVLDNAASVEQVRPLLPGSGSCLVVVTSRDSLAGLVAREGARRIDLDLLPVDDALRLLQRLVGTRVPAELDVAREIAEECARLPLALRVAAELAAVRPAVALAELAAELRHELRRLELLDAGGDRRTSVRAVLSWSYRHLPADAARAFRLLGLHPNRQWDGYAVAALTDTGIAPANQVLDVLARASLAAPDGRPDRFGMHDLLRAYAVSLVAGEDEDERRGACTRLLDHYLATAAGCSDVLFPHERHLRPAVAPARTPTPLPMDGKQAKAWLDRERPSLVAVAAHAARWGSPQHAIALSQVLWRYLFAGGHGREAAAIHGHALAAAQASGDRAAQATALRHLAGIAWRTGRFEDALEHSGRAAAVYRELDDRRAEGSALNTMGVVAHHMGRYHEAITQYRRAQRLATATGDRVAEGSTHNNLGTVSQRLGRHDEAVAHYRRALAIRREIGDRSGEGLTLGNLGEAYAAAGRVGEARDAYTAALAIARETGEANDEAHALNGLGDVLRLEGRPRQAIALHEEALGVARETDNRAVEATALNGLAAAVLADADAELALRLHDAALRLAGDIGERFEQARALEGSARALDAAGRPEAARARWRQARALYDDLGIPRA